MAFFKKKTMIYAPVDGLVKSIDQVNDEMFSTRALGDGFAVEPKNTSIYSPVEGTILSVFPTKHAISIKSKTGIEILVHIGIDTVELNGDGFKIFVEEGAKVSQNTKIAEVNFEYLKTQEKDTDVMVIFTNLDKKKLSLTTGNYNYGQEIGNIE
ncbi:PTS glucose transporter subunit IIA [Enterococcus canintestini]|uniref:PTS sugar transporter subunit IIA n=1 Tax=Enterococcus canintestini TaxID=317010 RepID=UPI00288DE7DA|nr:PTS glucose transporter subunit IIA [Enterococcus canintestini]MDT2738841.1 PTS glucose transporter subunit IIA [Enterococcus canintestini]